MGNSCHNIPCHGEDALLQKHYVSKRSRRQKGVLVFDSKLTTYRNLSQLNQLGIQFITLRDYEGPIRQIVVTDLGHEEPTFVLTNQLRRTPVHLIGRYAQRTLIENGIADSIEFFHMDARSSAVPMKVSCDLQLTLMASSLYRLFVERIGNGYATAKSQHIFRDFINAVANGISQCVSRNAPTTHY
jgi:hypothetical protein